MYYHNITTDDMNNGDGLRVVLWLSGCDHYCKNCQNQQTWNEDSGIEFDESAKNELFAELNKQYISGITLSGGDPLYKNNIQDVLSLINEIRLLFPTKTIWLYTGYTWEEIMNPAVTDDLQTTIEVETRKEIVSKCDILVDGRYVDELRDITLEWRGSSNQRVIDIKESLKQKQIIQK